MEGRRRRNRYFSYRTYSNAFCVRYLAKSEERRERVKRQVKEELLESMPSLTRYGALLRERVGKARPFSTTTLDRDSFPP